MRTKLAFRNVGKSIKDYAVYFFTLALGVCVFYMFNSIYAQQAMIGLTAEQTTSVRAIESMLSYVSVFVAVVLGFLIVYANGFFIKRRKKELGIYMTLGMEKRDISSVLLMETSFIALLALVSGLACGIFLSQFMSIFTAKLFEADMTQFSFVFSTSAAGKSILYFGIIFFVVILFNAVAVSRFQLIDLLYGGRKNQALKVKNSKVMLVFLTASVLMLGIAYYLIVKNGLYDINRRFFTSVALGTVGTLLFFYSLSGLLTTMIRANKSLYFKGLNMFVVRQLSSKINTNFISISVVSIVLLLTIGIFATGYGMQSVLSSELKAHAGYDLTLFISDTENNRGHEAFEELKTFTSEQTGIQGYAAFCTYSSGITYQDFKIDLTDDLQYLVSVQPQCISLSDYNVVSGLRGEAPISLSEEEYALMSNYAALTDYAEKVFKEKNNITIKGQQLKPSAAVTGSIRNGFEQLIIILPDQVVKKLSPVDYVLNIMCTDNEAAGKLENAISDYFYTMAAGRGNISYGYTSGIEAYANAVSQKAILSFISIYLGIVFMITCAAILAIQQLTEAEDNKSRYELLKKLGADNWMVNRALFIQILCYFLFPLFLAVIDSYFGLKAAMDTLLIYGEINIVNSGVTTAIFVGLLYTAYFSITYVGCRNIVERK